MNDDRSTASRNEGTRLLPGMTRNKRRALVIGGIRLKRGETRDIRLKVSETFTGEPVSFPIRVIRAHRPGPTLFVTAAVHGDEINGTGIVRELMFSEPPELICGTLICAPVVNVFGFETHDRYLPDRRDLNRSFPGSVTGSLASRMAHLIFHEIVLCSDFGIDLHSAALHRTNFPNVRGDMRDRGVSRLARAFGCEMIVSGKGPEGSLRKAACEVGCPTIILEAGEVAKMEPSVLEIGVRGIRNVLIELGMTHGEQVRPLYQTTVNRTLWVRAELGGLLRFHVAPGEIVQGGQPIATNESVFGDARSVIIAPQDSIVLGMITHPAISPGEPIVNLAVPRKSLRSIRKALERATRQSLPYRIRQDLSAGIAISDSADGRSRRRRK